MAIPGVVGVYVGLMDDGKTLCLKVMVSDKTQDVERQIPRSLEGYPVVIEKTGVIRPLSGKENSRNLLGCVGHMVKACGCTSCVYPRRAFGTRINGMK